MLVEDEQIFTFEGDFTIKMVTTLVMIRRGFQAQAEYQHTFWTSGDGKYWQNTTSEMAAMFITPEEMFAGKMAAWEMAKPNFMEG